MSKPIGLLRNEVTRLENAIARSAKESETILQRCDRGIAAAKVMKLNSELEKLTAERRHRENLFAKYAADAKRRLGDMREELVEREAAEYEKRKEKADEVEASAKGLARQQWLAKDGDPDVFEQSWHVLWRIQQDDKLSETMKEVEGRREAPLSL